MPGHGTRNLTQSRVMADVAESSDLALFETVTSAPRRIALKHLELGITLFFDLRDSVTLGRERSTQLEKPHVDLERYNAYQLGVSRRHAILSLEAGRVVLIDTNSANGTWLNRERLLANVAYPVLHGDTIQLGGLALQISYPADPFVVFSRPYRSHKLA